MMMQSSEMKSDFVYSNSHHGSGGDEHHVPQAPPRPSLITVQPPSWAPPAPSASLSYIPPSPPAPPIPNAVPDLQVEEEVKGAAQQDQLLVHGRDVAASIPDVTKPFTYEKGIPSRHSEVTVYPIF
jgi:hypothetical protein